MKILQYYPDISQQELTHQLGKSYGKMNYCLNGLIDKGLVKLDNFSTMTQKITLITGITGQDDSYLAEFLLEKAITCTLSNATPVALTHSA